MCYYTIQTKFALEVQSRFKAKLAEPSLFQPSAVVNGFEHPKTPVITDERPELIQHYNWGLLPHWAKDETIRSVTLNARIETLEEKPAYRAVIQQRCLVIANGFYEWQWLDTKGKNKVKYQIGLANEALFAFAGLYSMWEDTSTGLIRQTYTIVTTEANALMADIHNIKKRMPVILQPEDENRWLSHAPVHEFAFPYEVALVAKKADGEALTLW
ncbi:SOS response-associated peptidase [Flavobacterium lacus]|uniref:Abasic site processing protein n=1 Tax=Flavobacterium lacus TaxID=1353778 RepID=A0A328WJW0_9FLAO|nr:SOS response-associated peptidase [Flavobacterium lacus]RAR46490.1 putative SOS response-associated peptidase YedK [Flavobacterium lacus]